MLIHNVYQLIRHVSHQMCYNTRSRPRSSRRISFIYYFFHESEDPTDETHVTRPIFLISFSTYGRFESAI